MYTDLNACLNEVKTNPATRGLPGVEYDSYLTNQLEVSAGKNSAAETVYRPYYVAAKFLEQLRSQQTVSEADQAKFTGLALPIASLLGQQAALDKALGLTVPPGFEAVPLDESASGSGTQTRRYTRSFTSTYRP